MNEFTKENFPQNLESHFQEDNVPSLEEELTNLWQQFEENPNELDAWIGRNGYYRDFHDVTDTISHALRTEKITLKNQKQALFLLFTLESMWYALNLKGRFNLSEVRTLSSEQSKTWLGVAEACVRSYYDCWKSSDVKKELCKRALDAIIASKNLNNYQFQETNFTQSLKKTPSYAYLNEHTFYPKFLTEGRTLLHVITFMKYNAYECIPAPLYHDFKENMHLLIKKLVECGASLLKVDGNGLLVTHGHEKSSCENYNQNLTIIYEASIKLLCMVMSGRLGVQLTYSGSVKAGKKISDGVNENIKKLINMDLDFLKDKRELFMRSLPDILRLFESAFILNHLGNQADIVSIEKKDTDAKIRLKFLLNLISIGVLNTTDDVAEKAVGVVSILHEAKLYQDTFISNMKIFFSKLFYFIGLRERKNREMISYVFSLPFQYFNCQQNLYGVLKLNVGKYLCDKFLGWHGQSTNFFKKKRNWFLKDLLKKSLTHYSEHCTISQPASQPVCLKF